MVLFRLRMIFLAVLLILNSAVLSGSEARLGKVLQAGVSPSALDIRTSRYRVRFEGARITLFRNLLTGETYTSGRAIRESGGLAVRTLAGSVRMPAGRWRRSASGFVWEAGGELKYRLEVSIEAGDGGLKLRQIVQSKAGGLAGAAWMFDSLSLEKVRLVLPARGGRAVDGKSEFKQLDFNYPGWWEAQLAIFEGKKGCAAVWSADRECGFKNLRLRRDSKRIAVAFETEPEGAFASTRRIQSAEWRLNAFRGDWRAPAGCYKKLMRRLYPEYRYRPEQDWARRVQAVVMIIEPRDLITGLLDQLAPLVDPPKTLIYLPQWRQDLKNVNFPDYGHPHATFPAFIARARELGFRIMAHTNLPGCSVSHPAYESVRKRQVRKSDTGELFGWLWGEGAPQTFAYINPASPEWRKALIGEINEAVRKFGIDAVHLDVSGSIMNDANGRICGMNYGQGSRALHKELLDALPPGVVLGGEGVNEITAGFELFAQMHTWSGLPTHPVSAFLFHDWTRIYGYLGLPNPDTGSPTAYDAYNDIYEGQGVIPSLTLASNADLAGHGRGTARILRLMRLWQSEQPEADFSSPWASTVRFSYRGKSGDRIVVVSENGGTRLMCNNRVVYWRVSGVNEVRASWSLPGWPATLPGRIAGLNPAFGYWLEEHGVGDNRGVRIGELPPGAYISAIRDTENLMSIEMAAGGSPAGRCSLAIDREPMRAWLPDGVTRQGSRFAGDIRLPARFVFAFAEPRAVVAPFDLSTLSPAAGFSFGGVYSPLPSSRPNDLSSDRTEGSNLGIGIKSQASCGGVVKNAIGAHPPNHGQTWLSWLLRLPDKPLEISFSAGLNDGVARRADISYKVLVNGEPRWETRLASRPSWADGSVDLSSFAGQEVVIDLVTDSVDDNSYDWACWGNVRLQVRPTDTGRVSAQSR